MMMFFLVSSLLMMLTMLSAERMRMVALPVIVEQKSTTLKRGIGNGY